VVYIGVLFAERLPRESSFPAGLSSRMIPSGLG